jgi:hypothetical protein
VRLAAAAGGGDSQQRAALRLGLLCPLPDGRIPLCCVWVAFGRVLGSSPRPYKYGGPASGALRFRGACRTSVLTGRWGHLSADPTSQSVECPSPSYGGAAAENVFGGAEQVSVGMGWGPPPSRFRTAFYLTFTSAVFSGVKRGKKIL